MVSLLIQQGIDFKEQDGEFYSYVHYGKVVHEKTGDTEG